MKIRNPKRVATATIRGFLAQVVYCARRWVDLPPDAYLYTEANEDIDQYFFGDGELIRATEESIKDLSGTVSARNKSIFETIVNFLEAFQQYRDQNVDVKLIFTTTAAIAKQTVEDSGVDILREWAKVTGGTADTEQLFESIESLLKSKYPEPKADSKSDHSIRQASKRRDVLDVLTKVHNDAWSEFLTCVDWNFAADSVEVGQSKLIESVLKKCDGNRSKAEAIVESILAHVWRASTQKELSPRTLTAEGLNILLLEAEHRYDVWCAWERMANWSSWTNWNTDHANLVGCEPDVDSVGWTVVAYTQAPIRDEAAIASVWEAATYDAVIRQAARTHLKDGSFPEAFWADSTLQVRLLDALLDVSLEIYAVLRPTAVCYDVQVDALGMRRGDRQLVGLAAAEWAFECGPELESLRANRPALLAMLSCVGQLLSKWLHGSGASAVKNLARWLKPHVKLLVLDGEYITQEHPFWESL